MDTLKSHIYKVGQKDYRYSDICFDGENFWLSPRYNGPVVKWNPDIGIVKEFINPAKGSINENGFCFGRIIFCEGYVWLFPNYSKQTFKINVKSEEMLKVEEFKPDFEEGLRLHPAAYFFVQNIGSIIYAYDLKNGTFIEYDCKTQKKREKIIKYSQFVMENMKPMREKYFLCKNYYEQPLFALSDYIDNEISNYNSAKKQFFSVMNSNADGTAGKEIFNIVKSIVLL
jgi:hypothetical protein